MKKATVSIRVDLLIGDGDDEEEETVYIQYLPASGIYKWAADVDGNAQEFMSFDAALLAVCGDMRAFYNAK